MLDKIVGMNEDELLICREKMTREGNPPTRYTVDFVFEDYEQLAMLTYHDIPVPALNSKIVLNNLHSRPNEEYNYIKRRRWVVKDVLTILDPADTTKDRLLYDNKLRYEIYLIRSEDIRNIT